MRLRVLGAGVLVAVLGHGSAAFANNQTVNTTSFPNTFSPASVTIFQGETITWSNDGGFHNVRFDDGSFEQPPDPSSALWTVSRTFTTPGSFRYFCEAHGGPNGVGMSGTVNVTAATGYARPKGAGPMHASLAPAYKQCTSPNRMHGAPRSSGSCAPPTLTSDFLTVGTPDSNMAATNSVGAVTLRVMAGNVSIAVSVNDVRNKAGLTDYTGQLQARLPLRITDRLSGPSANEPATGDTTFALTVPCTTTGPSGDTTIGSNCSINTTANAVVPGAVVSGVRAIWQLQGVQVFDGGTDGLASTAPNTLFADQAVFVP